jgi:Flp pilus assembly protein TadD
MTKENPQSGSAYASLGEAYLQMRDEAKAREALQQAVNLGFTDEDVLKKLSRLQKAPPGS